MAVDAGAVANPDYAPEDTNQLSPEAQQVLDALPQTGAISGGHLRARISIDEDEFKQAKKELRNAGLVILGRGRGGSIARKTDDMEDTRTAGQTVLWAAVQRKQELYGCKCDLRPGMKFSELIALEEGCTGSRQSRARGLSAGMGWVCPALTYYRDHTPDDRQHKEVFSEDA